MLRAGWFGMLIFEDSLVNVERHVQVDEAIDVVPGECDADEKGAGPVDSDVIVFFECVLEVQDVGFVCGFDAKVVNN